MSLTQQAIKDFFANYAKALSSRDTKAIIQYWGVPTLVLSDQGVIAAAQIEEVDAFFASSMQQYEKVVSAHPHIKAAVVLTETVASCQVVWDHHDAAGQSISDEEGHYLLKHDGKALHIHVYTPVKGM